jgi:putative endonuclease
MGSGFWLRQPRNDNNAVGVTYFVYLLASRRHGTLYIGVTRDLLRRVWVHKNKVVPGFTTTYGVDRLVWYEAYTDVTAAITREKQIKKWRRDWKIALIEAENPGWRDLYESIPQ